MKSNNGHENDTAGLSKYEKYSFFFLAPFFLVMARFFYFYKGRSPKEVKQISLLILSGLVFWLIIIFVVTYLADIYNR